MVEVRPRAAGRRLPSPSIKARMTWEPRSGLRRYNLPQGSGWMVWGFPFEVALGGARRCRDAAGGQRLPSGERVPCAFALTNHSRHSHSHSLPIGSFPAMLAGPPNAGQFVESSITCVSPPFRPHSGASINWRRKAIQAVSINSKHGQATSEVELAIALRNSSARRASSTRRATRLSSCASTCAIRSPSSCWM